MNKRIEFEKKIDLSVLNILTEWSKIEFNEFYEWLREEMTKYVNQRQKVKITIEAIK